LVQPLTAQCQSHSFLTLFHPPTFYFNFILLIVIFYFNVCFGSSFPFMLFRFFLLDIYHLLFLFYFVSILFMFLFILSYISSFSSSIFSPSFYLCLGYNCQVLVPPYWSLFSTWEPLSTPCLVFYPEGGGSTFIWNGGIYQTVISSEVSVSMVGPNTFLTSQFGKTDILWYSD
jgi:hypothetical protein